MGSTKALGCGVTLDQTDNTDKVTHVDALHNS